MKSYTIVGRSRMEIKMYTKTDIMNDMKKLGIKSTDTLLIHSSMKAIGEVEGGAETVLDAFIEYMKDGLLILPTHTWKQMNNEYNVFDVQTEESCVGILTNLFMKRPGVYRSLHPTHSVAAIGKRAKEYIVGDEKCETPCPRFGTFGRLYDEKAKILLLGCGFNRNTFIHSVEEWCEIPGRLTDHEKLVVKTADGQMIDAPMRRHHNVSENYIIMEEPCLHHGITVKGNIGDAVSLLSDVVGLADLVQSYLSKEPDLFATDNPIPKDWYIS